MLSQHRPYLGGKQSAATIAIYNYAHMPALCNFALPYAVLPLPEDASFADYSGPELVRLRALNQRAGAACDDNDIDGLREYAE